MVPKISGTHEIYINEKLKNHKILVTKLGEKECYLCKQLGHFKRDCPNREKAKNLFSNRLNNVVDLPDDNGNDSDDDDDDDDAKKTTATTNTATNTQSENNNESLSITGMIKEIQTTSKNDAWNGKFLNENKEKKRKNISLNSSTSSSASPELKKTNVNANETNGSNNSSPGEKSQE